MTTLRRSHAVWVLRRAVALEDAAAEGPAGAPNPARVALLREVADKLTAAFEESAPLRLTVGERSGLLAEARHLAEQSARELRRGAGRNLAAAEEWMLIARALCEIAGASE